jgi:phosphatidylglycerol---prolipoprotein diacylglyceryl transferase
MLPHIFHIYGPLWIQSYGLMIAVAFFVFFYFSYYSPLRKKIISAQGYINLVFVSLLWGIVGGRVFYLLTNWQDFSSAWYEVLLPWEGGFAVQGSFVGIIVSIFLYARKNNLKLLVLIDFISLYAPLLQAISRIGCFLSGCCFGVEASEDFIFAVVFRNPDVSSAPLGVPLHPTQLYMSVGAMIVFIVLQLMHRYGNFWGTGLIFFMYFFLENIFRFYIDFFRGDRGFLSKTALFGMNFYYSYNQLISMILLFGMIVLYVIFYCRKKFFKN